MQRLKRIVVVASILLTCVGCDQATKVIAKQYLPRNDVLSFVGDTVRLQYAENEGAFLSIGATLPEKTRTLIFTFGVALVMVGILGYLLMASTLSLSSTIALSLVCGGGLSNLIDRVIYNGSVVDFLNVGISGIRTGIFNIADVLILSGAMLLLFARVREKPS